MSMTIEHLKKVRELIADVGWCQKSYRLQDHKDGVEAYCLSGACIQAAGYRFYNQPQYLTVPLAEAIEDRYRAYRVKDMKSDDEYRSQYDNVVIAFNDEDGRTCEEVLEMVDHAIVLLKERWDVTA